LLIYIEVPVPSQGNTKLVDFGIIPKVGFFVVVFLHFITTFGSFTTVEQFTTFRSFI
jgi:hypothetical protein